MKILLHMCCANCSAYPVKTLKSEGHTFTGFWFNPNIHPRREYRFRHEAVKELSVRMGIEVVSPEDQGPEDYFELFSLSADPDGELLDNGNGRAMPSRPERCLLCYRLRMEKTAEAASRMSFHAFSTTLLISPYQDYEQIRLIGNECADRYNVAFYLKDFRPYFRSSQDMGRGMGLYRQKYCGCIFSREERKRNKS